jgi:predicted thioredoxin/glutaredoxin
MMGITYISARAVKLAIVVNVEVNDVDCSAAIVLDDLVRCVVSTTTDDPGLLSGLVFFDGDGVLADILEPDELESAVTLAVYTFGLTCL